MRMSSSPPSPTLQSLYPTTDLPSHLLFFQLEYLSECLYCTFFPLLSSYFILFIFPILSPTDLFSSTLFCLHNFLSSLCTFLTENFKVSRHPPKVCSKFPFHLWNSSHFIHEMFINHSLCTHPAWCIFDIVYILGHHPVSLWRYWERDFQGQGHWYYQGQATLKCSEGSLPQ